MKKILLAALAGLALAAAPTAHADYVFAVCPSGQSGIVTNVTSCPFADSVRRSYLSYPATYVAAYSPVTGQDYVMACNANTVVNVGGLGNRLGVRCDGGNNAVVVFW